MSEVSIIIPVYNQWEHTKNCLSRLQTSSPAAEIIVVDNNSNDETAVQLPQLFPEVKIIRNETNLGFAKACNLGAHSALRPRLLFLNNDTLPLDGWFEALNRAYDNYAKVGAVGAKLMFPNQKLQHAGIVFDNDTPYHIYLGLPKNFAPANTCKTFQAVTGACLLTSRALFHDLGGFDESYLNGFEDIDFCLKLTAAGYNIYYEPKAEIIHLTSQTETRSHKDHENRMRFLKLWQGKVINDAGTHFLQDGFPAVAFDLLKTLLTQGFDLEYCLPTIWEISPGSDEAIVRFLHQAAAALRTFALEVKIQTVPEAFTGAKGIVAPNTQILKSFVPLVRPDNRQQPPGNTTWHIEPVNGEWALNHADSTLPLEFQYIQAGLALPSSSMAYLIRKHTQLLNKHDYESAAILAREVLDCFPFKTEGYMLIGHSLWAQRQYPQAKHYYEKCFHKDKGCALPVIRLAQLALEERNFASAERILDEFLKLKPLYLKALALKTKIKFLKISNFII